MAGTNTDVIDQLKAIIQELNLRRNELEAVQRRPGGELSERADRQALVLERLISLNLRIHNLSNRLTDRLIARDQKESVPVLDKSSQLTWWMRRSVNWKLSEKSNWRLLDWLNVRQ